MGNNLRNNQTSSAYTVQGVFFYVQKEAASGLVPGLLWLWFDAWAVSGFLAVVQYGRAFFGDIRFLPDGTALAGIFFLFRA